MSKTYFAMCEPLTYNDLQIHLSEMEKKLQKNQTIYFVREHLTSTLEGRRVDLLTITSFKELTFEREQVIDKLFPELSIHNRMNQI